MNTIPKHLQPDHINYFNIMFPAKETYVTNEYMVHVINVSWLAPNWVMKLDCLTKLTREICAWCEILDIHHSRLLQTILLIGINVLLVEHTPIRACTIHNLIKGFYVHYGCLINNYDA
jgi:hypothetical protein